MKINKNCLKEEYITKRKTLVVISNLLGFSRHKLTDLMKKHGIKIRSNAESHKRIQEKENNPAYKDGSTFKKHYCIDCKIKEISYSSWKVGTQRCRKCWKLFNKGKNHPSFINGEGNIPYPNKFNDALKEQIRKRDNYKCQNCSMTTEEHLIVRGINLHIHHIDYNKKNCNEKNLITLCEQCNLRANSNRNYWKEFYQEKLEGVKLWKKN